MQYTPPTDDSLQVQRLRPYERASYLERKAKAAKAVQRGLARVQKEDTYSFKRLLRTIREETLAIRLSERLDVQLWRDMYTEIIDGTTYLVQVDSVHTEQPSYYNKSGHTIHATHQAQKIPLREWWLRQLS